MKYSVKSKLILAYIIFGIAGFIVVSLFSYNDAFERSCKSHAKSLYKEALSIADSYGPKYFNSSLSSDDFQMLISSLGDYLNAEIWLTSTKGRIMIDSNESYSGTLLNDFDITKFGNKTYLVGTFDSYFEEEHLSVYAPVTVNYSIKGYIIIHLPLSVVNLDAQNMLKSVYLTYIIFMLILLAGMMFIMFTHVARIRKIEHFLKSYHAGDDVMAPVIKSHDELGMMSSYINFMVHQLDTLEDDQKKFISNISHDFRSPLTSLKGYITAMLDGTIPPENQEKYLNIVLNEANRLQKLSDSLLELNKNSSKAGMLDIITFDINETIRATIPTFEGTCRQRHISFFLSLTGKHLLVKADKSKIQQVLYNLIDNAIKFSFDDSKIDIDTTVKNTKVFISVKDHGQGIEKENLPKIWDRFYKSDASRGLDKAGSGIGLSIVKGIIQSHGENITVVSTPGAGTEFSFTLPLADEEL